MSQFGDPGNNFGDSDLDYYSESQEPEEEDDSEDTDEDEES